MFITSKKLSWYKSSLENPFQEKHRRRKILTNRGVNRGKDSSSNAVGARQKASIRLIVYNALNEQSWPSLESCRRKN
ncbi:hypothetical protein SDJN03_29928, partial [Cucurbita argyrosperma subsp. sororia]